MRRMFRLFSRAAPHLKVSLPRRFQSTLTPNNFEPVHPVLLKRGELLAQELTQLEDSMSSGFDLDQQKQFSRLSSIVETYRNYLDQVESFTELQSLLTDESLADDAQQELTAVLPQLISTASKLTTKLLPPHPFSDKPCILELRPGVGGVEAMIFALDLFNMYLGYANSHRWPVSIISKSMNQPGNGITEAIISIDEPGSYERLRFESGVHRVQRVPETESKGRTQTSTAAVVVLPQMTEKGAAEDADERTFANGEVRIDVMRASGKGGQHVNTTESAVRLTHIPTGITVSMQDERSQHKNKAKAFTILRARIAELERAKTEEEERKKRSDQVSTTDRSDKIRTYNFPQNRITDHRCGFSIHDVDGVMRGEKLYQIIDAMEQFEAEEKSTRLLDELESK